MNMFKKFKDKYWLKYGTALYVARFYLHPSTVDKLIKRKDFELTINNKDKYGFTAFHLASYYRNKKIFDAIAKLCPDITLLDSLNNTAFEACISSNFFHGIKKFKIDYNYNYFTKMGTLLNLEKQLIRNKKNNLPHQDPIKIKIDVNGKISKTITKYIEGEHSGLNNSYKKTKASI